MDHAPTRTVPAAVNEGAVRSIIEHTLEAWDARHPALNLAFRAAPLIQTALPLPPLLYKPHLDELIGRALAGGDTTQYSRAELLAILSEVSLRAPLSDDAYRLMARLFAEVLPGQADAANLVQLDPYPGDTERLRTQLARQKGSVRARLKGRVLKPYRKKGVLGPTVEQPSLFGDSHRSS